MRGLSRRVENLERCQNIGKSKVHMIILKAGESEEEAKRRYQREHPSAGTGDVWYFLNIHGDKSGSHNTASSF
jgi:hypothetical protein